MYLLSQRYPNWARYDSLEMSHNRTIDIDTTNMARGFYFKSFINLSSSFLLSFYMYFTPPFQQRLSPPIIPKLTLLPPPIPHPPHLPMPCFPTIITTPTNVTMTLPNGLTLPVATTPTLPSHTPTPSSSPSICFADSPLSVGPVKQRRVSDKCNLPISAGLLSTVPISVVIFKKF